MIHNNDIIVVIMYVILHCKTNYFYIGKISHLISDSYCQSIYKIFLQLRIQETFNLRC